MIVGVPSEIKIAEKRVAITPAGVKALVQAGAGLGSGFSDEEYSQAGAGIKPDAANIWSEADMVMKVKEPIGEEFNLMHEGQVLFTYLHLAADKELTEKLITCL